MGQGGGNHKQRFGRMIIVETGATLILRAVAPKRGPNLLGREPHMDARVHTAFAKLPLVAILRGLTPAEAKAWRAVLPRSAPILPVGGITPDNMGPYVKAGASGFGLGSALYKPGDAAADVRAKAAAFRGAWAALG